MSDPFEEGPFNDSLGKTFGSLFGSEFGSEEGLPLTGPSEEELERRRRGRDNVRVRFYEGGPEVDLGVTGPQLLSEALETLDRLTKAVKLEHVSPILSKVMERLRGAKKRDGDL